VFQEFNIMADNDKRKATLDLGSQEIDVPRFSLTVGDNDNRSRRRGNDYCDNSSSTPSWVWLLVGFLAFMVLGGAWAWSVSSVKDKMDSVGNTVVGSVNANTNSVGSGINANTNLAAAGVIAQDNVNTGAVRTDIANAARDNINATNAARDNINANTTAEAKKTRGAIWSANKATNSAIVAAKPDLSGLASKGDLNGLAKTSDVNAAGEKLEAWMKANQAKVTVTTSSAIPVQPQSAPAK